MTLFGFNQDKLIESLLTLPQAKELREGEFSLTLKEAEAPSLSIALRIHMPERTAPAVELPAPRREQDIPQVRPAIRIIDTSSYFLEQCHIALFEGAPDFERQFLVSGMPRGEEAYYWDLLIPVTLNNPSRYGVEADMTDLLATLANLDLSHGLMLLGVIHSHLYSGRGAVNPSETDRRLQKNLEESGYKTVQAIFSTDGYIGFFTNTIPFALTIIGTGVEEVETNDFQTVVRLKTAPHLSDHTLPTKKRGGTPVFRSAGAHPRV